jgi:hypothetical protein
MGQPLGELSIHARSGQTLFQKSDVTQDHGQQIVEIMRYARGQLSDGFQPLHLSQRGLYPFALLNLRPQLMICRRKLCRTIRDPSLELLIQAAAFVLF